MRPFDESSAAEMLEAQAKGDVSAEELVRACIERIEARDETVHAYLSVDVEGSLERARDIDARRAKGKPLGPLAGLPLAIKDNICTRGRATTCASRILEHFRPPYDATVVEKLHDADAVLVGKTNMDEFAFGSSTETSAFGPTRNPWDTTRVPGGSSGGSAAAVAARLCAAAVGSSTGGSVRQPAGFCGVTGLKPTYGRVSRYGLIAFGSSLDQVCPLGRDARDAALLLSVLAGHDRRDSTSLDAPVSDYLAELDDDVKGMKLGLPAEYFGEGLEEDVRRRIDEATDVLHGLGCETVEISLPHTPYGVAAYYVVATAEASSNLARFDGVHYGHRTREKTGLVDLYAQSREEGLGDEVKRRVMLGTYALSSGYYDAYYLKGLRVRRRLKEDFDRAWERVDAVLAPTSPTTAFALGERIDDPLSMYLADVFTISANMTGVPAISIPCGFDREGLPVGLQLMAPNLEETRLLRIARAFQAETDYHLRRPTP
jgi:aspartyl-tRNA(Asn)/glutamyl-tRNA(Gln) amidotransferase subunit A